MPGEYLLFNLLVLAGPVALSFWSRTRFVHLWPLVAAAAATAAVPYVAWDAWVTGRHWWFNPEYSLPHRPLGLPPGEWLFFLTVPFACIFTWRTLAKPERGHLSPGRGWIYLAAVALLPLSVWLWSLGKEYTSLAVGALGVSAIVDRAVGTRLLTHTRYPRFVAMLMGLTFVFNGYLTARPVVLYDASYQLDVRIWTVPVEDFVYGLSLMNFALIFFHLFTRAPGLSRLIERRFRGYKHPLTDVDPGLPETLSQARLEDEPRRVAVVGGGVAGLLSAAHLAERGFQVELFEANDHVGGKLGSWMADVGGGERMRVEHGFHAFFRHYYNLNHFLDRLGLREAFEPIDDYTILGHDGKAYGFASLHRTPILNLISLLGTGMMKIRDVFRPEMKRMQSMMEYDERETFQRWDDISFQTFADDVRLPRELQLVFNSFSRAFFASPEDMSMAELIKSFHFYYLSHDHGLLYDIPNDDHEYTVLAPIRAHLEAHGVQIHLERPVRSFEVTADAVEVEGERFDYAVLAADVMATRSIVRGSTSMSSADPDLAARLGQMHASQRYAVVRLWVDKDTERDLPGFVMTDRIRLLDSVSLYHRFERSSADYVAREGGGVFELHCYAVPDDFGDDANIRDALVADFFEHFPELEGCQIRHEHAYVKRDFTAFHTGLHEARPETVTAHPRVLLAGDWVRLPCPAMLLEAAATSGMLAANRILEAEGVRPVQLYTVPLSGFLPPTSRGRPGANLPRRPRAAADAEPPTDGASERRPSP